MKQGIHTKNMTENYIFFGENMASLNFYNFDLQSGSKRSDRDVNEPSSV